MRVHAQLQPHIGLCLVSLESPPPGWKCRVTVTRDAVTVAWDTSGDKRTQAGAAYPAAHATSQHGVASSHRTAREQHDLSTTGVSDGHAVGTTESVTVLTAPGVVDLSQPVRYTQHTGALALRVPLQRYLAADGVGVGRPPVQPRPERVHAGLARKLPATLACARCRGRLSTRTGVIDRAVSLPTEGWAELCE